jgi:glycosyltransferase involved in cell wall biosynthesis
MAQPSPLISVIIPTYNRRAQLLQCLASLASQTYPQDRWEVVVVIDDNSDPLDPALADWSERLPLRFTRQPHAGCGIARNTGSSQARGRYLVFTDDDCLFPPDWLSRYAEHFERTRDCVIAGRTVNALPHNPYSQTTQEVQNYLLSHFNSGADEAALAVGNNFGVSAEGFRALGGFSGRYFQVAGGEDFDFAWRWREQGRRIVYAPDVVVHHAHGLTFASFLRQHFNYGRGAWLFHHPQVQEVQNHPGLEDLGFYVSLLLRPWVVCKGFSAARLFVLLLVSQAAHTVGYLSGLAAAVRRRTGESAIARRG